jgi:hypothetical protein
MCDDPKTRFSLGLERNASTTSLCENTLRRLFGVPYRPLQCSTMQNSIRWLVFLDRNPTRCLNHRTMVGTRFEALCRDESDGRSAITSSWSIRSAPFRMQGDSITASSVDEFLFRSRLEHHHCMQWTDALVLRRHDRSWVLSERRFHDRELRHSCSWTCAGLEGHATGVGE